jgi:hypothetical protein
MRRTAKLSVRLRISNTSGAFFMSTAIRVTSRWRRKGTSCSRHAGAIRAQAANAPIAVKALRRIGELYAVEADVHGQSPAQRLAARRRRSKPIIDALRAWLEAQLPLLSQAV